MYYSSLWEIIFWAIIAWRFFIGESLAVTGNNNVMPFKEQKLHIFQVGSTWIIDMLMRVKISSVVGAWDFRHMALESRHNNYMHSNVRHIQIVFRKTHEIDRELFLVMLCHYHRTVRGVYTHIRYCLWYMQSLHGSHRAMWCRHRTAKNIRKYHE